MAADHDATEASAEDHFVATSMGLLRVFTEEAMKTAGELAVAQRRTVVSDEDTVMALKFQARMFFQRVQDLDGRVKEAVDEFWAEMDIDSSDEEEEDGEEGEDDGEDEGSDVEGTCDVTEDRVLECQRTRHNVEAVCRSWSAYEPTDPVLILIKDAIDAADRKHRPA